MCGIAAMWGEPDEELFVHAMRQIKHRGPDGGGTEKCGSAVLGHARLAIVDVGGGIPTDVQRASGFGGRL